MAAACKLKIAQHRQNLYTICKSLEMDDEVAARIAKGTFFGCNSNYKASGFDLTDEECQLINAEYDAIERLTLQILRLEQKGML